VLLTEGQDPDRVIDGINDVIRRFERVTSGDRWQAEQNDYLQLLETLEGCLRSWFEDDDGTTAQLRGEQYRLIVGMNMHTPRPHPLIKGEVDRQVRALQRLKTQLEDLLPLRKRPGDLVIFDTNALMHYQRLDTIPWATVLGATQVRIILPICVIDELDNKKYAGSDRMSRRASDAIRALRDHSKGLRPGSAATLEDGTTLEVFLDPAGHKRKANPDEELLSRCTLLQRVISRPVTIVTGDLGAQLRADAGGLAHAEMPDKYAKDVHRRKQATGD
jgi:hypothetical protein